MCTERYIKVKLVLLTGAPCVVKCVCVSEHVCTQACVRACVCWGKCLADTSPHGGAQRYPLGCCQSFRRLQSMHQACLDLS